MGSYAILAAIFLHGLTVYGAPPEYDLPPIEYDYTADVEAQEAMIAMATTPPAPQPTDPLADAREMARLNIMDRILIALGPPFGEKLPKAPTSDTLATVPTPLNITTDPCPYKYKRCSSQTFFPSCNIPRNTAPEIWPQYFNLFFNLSESFDNKLDVINATLRLYKNTSLPLQRAKTLLIKAFVYTKSLTRRRKRTKLVADTQVASDYIGWVTLSVAELVRRWKRRRSNHGVLITVNDIDAIPWDAQDIFVTMDCASGLLPLPFEILTDREEGQQYPALNVRLGSPDDDPQTPALSSTSSPLVSTVSSLPNSSSEPYFSTNSTELPPTPTMQSDDPVMSYVYDYESDVKAEEAKERQMDVFGVVQDIGDVGEVNIGVPQQIGESVFVAEPRNAVTDRPAANNGRFRNARQNITDTSAPLPRFIATTTTTTSPSPPQPRHHNHHNHHRRRNNRNQRRRHHTTTTTTTTTPPGRIQRRHPYPYPYPYSTPSTTLPPPLPPHRGRGRGGRNTPQLQQDTRWSRS